MMRGIIAQLEAATDGNGELDVVIHGTLARPFPPESSSVGIPRYTGSLDAALTLVPKQFAWSVQSSGQFPGQAWLYPPNNHDDIQYQADGESPALALCIAALKARAQYETARKDGAA